MKYDLNIREESFGATINNICLGKREYVTKEELNSILVNQTFPQDLMQKKFVENKKYNIKLTKIIENEKFNKFSFADIIFIELTRACNLNCTHCLNSSGKTLKNQLNHKEFVNLIQNLADSGAQEIRFTGGEPLLYKNIYELIELASNNGMNTSLGTNGTLITKSVAHKLKESGLNKAVVSIDGTKTKHDEIRGKGNFSKAFEGLNNLIEEGITVRVNSVLLKSNIDDVIDIAKDLHKKKIHLFIRRFIESGRGENLKDSMLNVNDYNLVREKLKYELENGSFVNGHYLKNDEGTTSRINLNFEIRGCKAGQRAIAIMPDGEIQLCGFLAAQGFPSVGNAKEITDWRKYWQELQNFDKLLNLRNKLDEYNKQNNIQETYCLAYIQRYLNKEKK